jgi:hypothetical protein
MKQQYQLAPAIFIKKKSPSLGKIYMSQLVDVFILMKKILNYTKTRCNPYTALIMK